MMKYKSMRDEARSKPEQEYLTINVASLYQFICNYLFDSWVLPVWLCLKHAIFATNYFRCRYILILADFTPVFSHPSFSLRLSSLKSLSSFSQFLPLWCSFPHHRPFNLWYSLPGHCLHNSHWCGAADSRLLHGSLFILLERYDDHEEVVGVWCEWWGACNEQGVPYDAPSTSDHS